MGWENVVWEIYSFVDHAGGLLGGAGVRGGGLLGSPVSVFRGIITGAGVVFVSGGRRGGCRAMAL